MKKVPKPWSVIGLLAMLAISMAVLIAVFVVVNPASKTLSELITAIVICSVVLAASLGFIAYFLIPRKLKPDAKLAEISKDIDTDGEKWKGKTSGDIEKYLKYHSDIEEILWSGQTSKTGGVMLAAKISLILVVVFEVIFAFIAAFWNIGLSSKPKTFLVLQAYLLIPAVVFFLMCLQTAGSGHKGLHETAAGFSYRITTERVYLFFGRNDSVKMSDWVVYEIKDIIGLKIKYAFYERNKQHGTIKIKVNNRRLAPLRKHIYSIPEPEKAFAILQDCINTPRESGYAAKVFENKKCDKCGGNLFSVETKPIEPKSNLYRLVCKHCNEIQYIENSAELWKDAELWDGAEYETIKCKCAGAEKYDSFYITLGYALDKDNLKKWLYIGCLCDECNTLGCFDVLDCNKRY